MSIAQAFRRITRRQVIHRLVGQAGHLYIQQRHIDMRANATGLTYQLQGGQACD